MASRSSRVVLLALLLLVVTGGLAAFAWRRHTASPEEPAAGEPGRVLTVPTSEEAGKALEAQQKLWDEIGRGLLASFDSRVYRPARDGKLARAEGTVDVRADGRDARWRVVFDGSKPERQQVEVTPVQVPEGLSDDVARQVKAWAILSLRGAYPGVAYFVPPTSLDLQPSKVKGHRVVWAKPYREEPENVSYNFDERDLVVSRGEWITGGPQGKPVWSRATNYEWEFLPRQGRHLLRRATVFEGATTDYEHEERDGVHLLRKVRFRQGQQAVDAVFSYESLRK